MGIRLLKIKNLRSIKPSFAQVFCISTGLFLGLAPSRTYAEKSNISLFKKAVQKFETQKFSPEIFLKEKQTQDVSALRKLWLSAKLFQRFSSRYEKTKNPEIAFQLARHAFVLGFEHKAQAWLNRLDRISKDTVWKQKGLYLRGALALKKTKKKAALLAFSKAASINDATQTGRLSQLAMARIAYDQGDYKTSKKIYEKLSQASEFRDAILTELAWTHAKLKRPDLALAEVQILFSLHRESDLIPKAGHLLATLFENEKDMREGTKALERLETRFTFEEDSLEQASQKLKDREEELILEFDPSLAPSQILTILSPIARKFLQRQPNFKIYLSELQEVQFIQDNLFMQLKTIESIQHALNQPGASIIETATLLDWANSIEKKILGFPALETDPKLVQSLKQIKNLEHATSNLEKDVRLNVQTLKEIERHIRLRWMILTGDRERLAIKIKSQARKLLHDLIRTKKTIGAAKLKIEALRLRLQKKLVLIEIQKLKSLRAKMLVQDQRLMELDKLRVRIRKKDQTLVKSYLKTIPELKTTLLRDLQTANQTLIKLFRNSRKPIARALKESQRRVAETLSLYRWLIAETRYKNLRQIETRLTRQRTQSAKEFNGLEDRLALSTQSPSSIKFLEPTAASREIQKRIQEASHFAKRALIYQQDLESGIASRVQKERDFYEASYDLMEKRLIDTRDILREQTLAAYRLFSTRSYDVNRLPYALYRIAQLHYERANTIVKAFSQAFPKVEEPQKDYSKATKPLKKIRDRFETFPFRDSALYLLGYTLLESGENAQAVKTFKKLIAEYPQSSLIPEVQLRVGEYYFSQHRFAKSIPHYQEVLKAGFNYFYDKALYKLAWSNYLLGRYDSSIAYFLILLDYSEELPQELKERYVQFSGEATEYIAFSLYRSGGKTAANRIFSKIGWKAYGRPILERLAHIYLDRSNYRGALQSLDMLIQNYPNSRELPLTLESRIKILELTKQNSKALSEKERLLSLLNSQSSWNKAHKDDSEIQMQAQKLRGRVSFSLATQYDTLSQNFPKKPFQQKANSLYSKVIQDFPRSKEAYDAKYRLAELEFLSSNYKGAASHFDEVVRNGKFNHHFQDALYGIVVSWEQVLTQKGGVKTTLAKSNEEIPSELENLVHSIDNFSTRAPRDPRVPQALFRSAQVLKQMGNPDQSKTVYLRLVDSYPKSEWTGKALLGAVDAYIANERWQEASKTASELLKSREEISSPIKARLKDLEEGSKFKLASHLEKKGESEKAIGTYLAFQKEFPSSNLAPKAVFNAFVLSKRIQDLDKAEQSIDLLITRYPDTNESKLAHLERALVLDKAFDFDSAIQAYEKALLAKSLAMKKRRLATDNLIELLSLDTNLKRKFKKMLSHAKKLKDPDRSDVELVIADRALRDENKEKAKEILTGIVQRSSSTRLQKSLSLAKLISLQWEEGLAKKAKNNERNYLKLARKLRKANQSKAQSIFAQARSRFIAFESKRLAKYRIQPKSLKTLSRTFKKKARRLAQLEKAVVDLLKLRSSRANAYALFQLGFAYSDFTKELQQLKLPSNLSQKDQKEFGQIIQKLSAPLRKKAKQTLSKSYEILVTERLSEPYFKDLVSLLKKVEAKDISIADTKLIWVDGQLPSLPTFLKDDPLEQNQKAQAELKSGISKLQSFWSLSQRKEAKEYFRRSLLSSPNYTPALYNLAILQLLDGENQDFQRSLLILRKRASNEDNLNLEIVKALLSQEYRSVLSLSSELLLKNPKHELSQWHRILALLALNKRKQALVQAKSFVRNHVDSKLALRALAKAYLANGETSKAHLILQRAWFQNQDDPALASELALVLNHPEDLPLRSKLLENGARTHDPESSANWAKMAFDLGLYKDASRELEIAFQAGGRYHPTIVKNKNMVQNLLGNSK